MQEGDQKGHWSNNFLCSGNQSSLTAGLIYERDMQISAVVHSDQKSVSSVFWLPCHKNYLEGKIFTG